MPKPQLENNLRRRLSLRAQHMNVLAAIARRLREGRHLLSTATSSMSSEALWSRYSRPVALKIAGSDLNGALEAPPLPIHALFESSDALRDLGDRFRFSVETAGRIVNGRLCGDHRQFFPQIFGHLFDGSFFECMHFL